MQRNAILNNHGLTKEQKIFALMKIPNVGWCFTDYSEQAPEFNPKMRCLVYQQEICEKTLAETGEIRLHWQCGFNVNNEHGIMFKTALKLVPKGVHLEPALGLWKDIHEYCTADETHPKFPKKLPQPRCPPVILGDPPAFGDELKKRKVDGLYGLATLIQQGASLKKVALSDPATFIRNYRGLQNFATLCKPADQVVYKLDQFTLPPPIIPDVKTQTHLIFEGQPFIGKTSWLRACFPLAKYVYQNVETLIGWDPTDHDMIIFDDCDFTTRHRNEQLQFVQSNVTQVIKVRNVNIEIPQFYPRIFIYNKGHYPFGPEFEEAIEDRLQKVSLGEKNLYK